MKKGFGGTNQEVNSVLVPTQKMKGVRRHKEPREGLDFNGRSMRLVTNRSM